MSEMHVLCTVCPFKAPLHALKIAVVLGLVLVGGKFAGAPAFLIKVVRLITRHSSMIASPKVMTSALPVLLTKAPWTWSGRMSHA
jgi:hypothetical protein